MGAEPLTQMLSALAKCTFLPASFDKRFVRDMLGRNPEAMTEKQRRLVSALVQRYRRQIPASVVALARDAEGA